MLELGNTSEFINKGLIFFISTFGDHSRLGNWHPVTLLRNIDKILSKVLSQTLQPFLPGIIGPNQRGFVKGRACGCKSWASHPHAKFVQRVWWSFPNTPYCCVRKWTWHGLLLRECGRPGCPWGHYQLEFHPLLARLLSRSRKSNLQHRILRQCSVTLNNH